MEQKTVNILYTLVGDITLILEVIDTDNIKFVQERQKYYEELYKNVRIISKVKFIIDKNKGDKL